MDESSFSYPSTVDVGLLVGAPKPVGTLPGAFFSVRGCDLTSFGTEEMSKGSSEGTCIVKYISDEEMVWIIEYCDGM